MNIQNVLIATLPVVGVIIGATLQYIFSRSTEDRKQLSLLRTQAYIDYIRCVAESKHVGKENHQARKEILSKAAEAKTRISIYGSSDVVTALAGFEKVGAIINSEQSEEKFLALCKVMRRETIGKIETDMHEAIKIVLFGSRN